MDGDRIETALLRSWVWDPWLCLGLALAAGLYLRGWSVLRRRAPARWGGCQAAAFVGGLVVVLLALASPVEPLSALLLQVHMVQHLLLMMVAPPLIWLGAPLWPLLRGLPASVRRHAIGPFLRDGLARSLGAALSDLRVAWLLFVGLTWLWHVPALFDAALVSPGLHYVEHLCFFGSALVFWWPVVLPYPAQSPGPRWLILPYLLFADVQNTVLSALLAFSDSVIYPHYERVPRLWDLSALEDQAIAGVIMWVPGSMAFLLPLGWIGCGLLFGSAPASTRRPAAVPRLVGGRIGLPLAGPTNPATPDLLRLPLLGRFLRWRHARTLLQGLMLVLAGAIILDGWLGPPVEGMNLAGIVPWIHWRGLVVLGLLALGNVFCLACPFLLPRTWARRWQPARRSWPSWLRSKWLAVAFLVVFFWAYETFALWADPWATASLAAAYFLAAFVVDSWFRGAAFCKYLCPIGQFNFVQSLVSPWEVRARSAEVCQRCDTKDCIRGRGPVPGCELHLFIPRKVGNWDCIFCLDCIHACPHDNVGILARIPGQELLTDPQRSGVGRLGRRADVALLVLLLVFVAFVNAAGMTAPVLACQDRLAERLGWPFWAVVTLNCIFALGLVPVALVGSVALLSRLGSGSLLSPWGLVKRYALAFVPLGFGMWMAHYGFHLVTSWEAIFPVTLRVAQALGFESTAELRWVCRCNSPVAEWLLQAEILCLQAGLLGSLYLAYRISLELHPVWRRAVHAFLPWAGLVLLLFAVGLWIVFQPMEMRGMM
ncbi:MAG: cytochrome c oxidase assembly protein [Gemmataceae bacterium]|nr:cytochrome c oxidase assembly protein [Gemmataceae bacterium]MDW8265754.1 cytochrome c oxidase assembly protein [Gemmataceae bacterium]